MSSLTVFHDFRHVLLDVACCVVTHCSNCLPSHDSAEVLSVFKLIINRESNLTYTRLAIRGDTGLLCALNMNEVCAGDDNVCLLPVQIDGSRATASSGLTSMEPFRELLVCSSFFSFLGGDPTEFWVGRPMR